MKKFETVFKTWIEKNTNSQIKAIDKISSETGIDTEDWFFNNFLRLQTGDFSGTDFLEVLLENYLCNFTHKFEKIVGEYLESTGTSFYGEPIYDIDITLDYDYKKNCVVIDEQYGNRSDVEKTIKSISLDNKIRLTKNKIFTYVINETKLNIFSEKEARILKLNQLNEL